MTEVGLRKGDFPIWLALQESEKSDRLRGGWGYPQAPVVHPIWLDCQIAGLWVSKKVEITGTKKEVLELGKSKWQQKPGSVIFHSCNAEMKPDTFAVRWVLDNESLEKGMGLLTCTCTPLARVQLKKKMSQFAEPEMKVRFEVLS